ncbi:MAG: sugar ABC transporter permease [Proteobacteria bacterium]|nr:MAG: sugar ABC transporter permease [Pseudomonadota bacterium]
MGGAQARLSNQFMWFCMAPVILFLVIVSLAPLIVAIIDSLRELSLTVFTKRGAFVGLENYRELLGDDAKFFASLWRTVVFVLVVVPFEFVFGLAIALYINHEFAGRRLLITLLMLPTMIAPVVVGMMWRYLLMPSFGLLTHYLQQMGFLAETSIFSDQFTAFAALMIIDIWEWTPFMMLIMLAGLTAMPDEPIEAAHLDGANRWQVLWHVQLSFLRPLIIFAVMFRAIEASKVFDTIYILTGGGPGNATETIATFAFRTTFIKWDLGYGATICLVLAFFSLVVAALFFKVTNQAREQ